MTEARYMIGDVFERMKELPDTSVDLIMCSPPFLALRSYLPADHPDKGKEIGSEPTPAAFIETLLALSTEWRRILAPHGSICIELGDTYSGSGGGGGDYLPGGFREGQPGFGGSADKQREGNAAHWRAKNACKDEWPLAKSLCLIPELYRIALVYGINPLTGQPSPAGRWRARNVVRWHRPNPPVGALGDKFRPATSDMVIACTSAKRYFDLDAVREPGNAFDRDGEKRGSRKHTSEAHHLQGGVMVSHPAGAPPLDTWVIPTEPYKGAHYATWPRDLCTRPILAMCPQHVCQTCGEPRRRIVEQTDDEYARIAAQAKANGIRRTGFEDGAAVGYLKGSGNKAQSMIQNGVVKPRHETVGWSDCGHNNYRRGLVLDPFAGTGTTLAVATGHGRDAIGIDLDARNLDLARERVGMFLTTYEAGEVAV